MKILRFESVIEAFGYRSRTSIYNAIKKGLLTHPVAIGTRSVGWPEHEVARVRDALIAGSCEDEIRTLVTRLHEQRAKALDLLEVL